MQTSPTPTSKAPPSQLFSMGKAAGILAFLAALLMVTVFRIETLQSIPCAFRNPLLCAEFPSSGIYLRAVLHDAANTRDVWKSSLYTDLGLIVGYVGLLAFGGLLVARKSARAQRVDLRRFVGYTIVVLAIIAGLFDVFENRGILLALERGADDARASQVNLFASVKMSALSLCAIALSAMHKELSATPLRAILLFLAAACGVVGLVGWQQPKFFEFSSTATALSVLHLWILSWKKNPQA